ncbi:MAG TPA: ubiquinol-cytochrome c reductase iron-sulfur subunit [Syntrophales bacterium]|nr:ubiquinol-cytochrome c reductase iron-sulfur subunit [Syntrophales bacterium]
MSEEQSTASTGLAATRRVFIKGFTGMLVVLCSVLVGVPLVGSLVGPVFRKIVPGWMKIGSMAALPLGQPAHMTSVDVQTDAYIRESVTRHIWAIRKSDTEVTVFSPICPHLGCHFDWNPSTKHFECPCHGSVYSLDGKVLGGPAPRPLDTLPTKIENGELYAEWMQFKSGTAEKIPV